MDVASNAKFPAIVPDITEQVTVTPCADPPQLVEPPEKADDVIPTVPLVPKYDVDEP